MVLAHDINGSQRTNDVQITKDVTFDIMLLSSITLEGLKKSGFVRPSPIQLHGIPLGKCGFDLLMEAKSGTGKTAVFSVIALEKLDLNKGLQIVILAPTREIAAQICDVLRQIGCQYDGLCVEFVIGGLSVQDDIEKFKENNVHIVVGSPGRVKHLISEQHIDVSAVRLLVLDEADKLMEKCFLADIKFINSAMPEQKQVIMSSATYSESCKEYVKEFVRDVQHICPNSDCVLLGVVQKVTYVKYNSNSILQTRNRFRELLKIITKMQFKQCLIFCNYQARVGEVYKMLTREKWPAQQLYGAQDQNERLNALKTLQEYKCRILIATDLAARGIDASNVDLVINFEPPFEWQTYLHRIGRAGRFGSYGMAITILSEGLEQNKFLNMLSTVTASIKLSPLWKEDDSNNNDEEKKTSEDVSSQLTNGFEHHDHTELWKIICNDDNLSNTENIESFQELSNSFQTSYNSTVNSITENNSTTNNIETFSDLFTSFQNNNLSDTTECQYKCMTCPYIPTKQYLYGIKSKMPDITKQIDQSHHNITSYLNEIKKAFETSKISEKQLKYNDNIPISKISYKNSTKSCCNNVENYCDKIRIQKSSSHTGTDEALLKNNDCQRNKANCTDKHTVSSSSKDMSNKSMNHCQSNIRKAELNSSSTYNKTTQNGLKNSCVSEAQSKVKSAKYVSENAYVHWYNQLKLRVRQIELEIYLDEVSKLH